MEFTDKYPESLTLKINNTCNSRCVYCSTWISKEKIEPALKDINNILISAKSMEIPRITLTGGEPFLRNDLLEVVRLCKAYDFYLNIITNLLDVPKSKLNKIVESGLDCITISYDSCESKIYQAIRGVSIKTVNASLEHLLDLRKRISLTLLLHCVISRKNYQTLTGLVDYCQEKNIYILFQPIHHYPPKNQNINDDLYFQPEDEPVLLQTMNSLIAQKKSGYPIANNEYHLSNFTKFLIKGELPADYRCRAGYETIAIDEWLNIRPCWKIGIMGNLFNSKLEQIWKSPIYAAARRKMMNLECEKCWYSCYSGIEEHLVNQIVSEAISY